MNIKLLIIIFVGLYINPALESKSQSQNSLPYFSDPSFSPDGSEVAFVSGGDIWTVHANGGEARLLISNPASESRPLFSPDGISIAFNSSRTGNGDVYVMNMKTGITNRVTYDDGEDELSAWSKDGKYIYFTSASRDISGMGDVYRVNANGGTPMPLSDNRYVNEFHASPSPDGKTIAISARGFGSFQWWRNGSSHLDKSEIWLVTNGKEPVHKQLTEREARQLWPMWSQDGQTIYYVSDRSGTENLWAHPINGIAKQITTFTSGRVLWPSIATNGKSIVFERDFSIWKFDIDKGQAAKINITLRGSPAAPSIERAKLSTGFRDLALSPDGKKVAFTAHGEVFVAAAKEGGEAIRITITNAAESQPTWAGNSNRLYYISERNGTAQIFQHDFITNKESQLTSGSDDVSAPRLSPDGKWLIFIRNGQQLHVIDLASNKERLLTKSYLDFGPFGSAGSVSWSPDSKWLAFAAYGTKSLRNIYVVSLNGSDAKPVSFLANSRGGRVHWSRDGKSIFFITGQRTENGYVAKIDLVPQLPMFREDQFKELFVDQTPDPPKKPGPANKNITPLDSIAIKAENTTKKNQPVRIEWEGIRQRLSLLPLGTDVNDMVVSKDGNTLVLIANTAGQPNLYSYSLDELSKEPAVLKQLTFTAAAKRDPQFSADGKEIFFLEGGRIHSVSLDLKQSKPLTVTAEMDIDFSKEKNEVFKQAWKIQNKAFYDATFHGKDWQAVRKIYEPYAAGAQTTDELRRILNLMVGELNASHSGVGEANNPTFTTGRLGLYFDRSIYEKEGKLKIKEVVSLSPSALSEKISVGDYLIAIDGKAITGNVNLEQLLENKINRKVILSVSPSSAGTNTREVSVRPVNLVVEEGLLYRQWVQQKRDYVYKASNGRLGYVHMLDMTQNSLNQLYLDMDAENHSREGVVVDVRNNTGGFVNAYALDVFARKGYMTMTARGLPTAPARVQLGQRALDAPTILVTNQHSLSDAEDFSEGYRTLGLGKIVGEPTAGWIIYTSSIQLIDGSNIRVPFIKITDSKGNNMELVPRPVDIPVTNPLGEKDKDRQLDIAVKELLKQLDATKK